MTRLEDWENITRGIRSGDLVVLPTDTVYGIGADPYSRSAVSRLLEAKGRGQSMPPPVLAADWESALALADWELFPGQDGAAARLQARRLAAAYWPGALTLIVPTSRNFGWEMGTHGSTVAVRVPDQAQARELLSHTGPLAVTSANLTGKPPALTASEARSYFGHRVAHYLDGGRAREGQPSTIVDATATPLRAIRVGALDWEDIKRTLEAPEAADLG